MTVGRTNENFRNIRKNTAFDQSEVKNNAEDISQEVIHEHEWTFREEYTKEAYSPMTLKSRLDRFVRYSCHCGAVKRVKQFEVEE